MIKENAIHRLLLLRHRKGNTELLNESLDMAIEALRQPERKTGHWIRHPEQKNIYGGKCIECSECGEKYIVQYIEDEKFCRNCGADMIGEEDERNKDF